MFDESSNTDNKRETGQKRKLQNCYILCYRLNVLSFQESILLVIKCGEPSPTKFKLFNVVVEHAIVIFEHAIMIFKHAIVQLKYEIQNELLILLFNMKPLIGLFKVNIHYATTIFVFEGS